MKLASLKPQIVELKLPAPYDGQTYPIYTMTWGEWESIGADVPDVDAESVPKVRVVEGGRVVLKDDRKALMQLQQEVDTRRLLRRLAYALQKTGEYEDLNGVSLDDAEALVGELGASAVRAMSGWLIDQIRMAQARVHARAERFQNGRKPAPDDAGTVALGTDGDAVSLVADK